MFYIITVIIILLAKYYYGLQFKIQLKIIYYPTIQTTKNVEMSKIVYEY